MIEPDQRQRTRTIEVAELQSPLGPVRMTLENEKLCGLLVAPAMPMAAPHSGNGARKESGPGSGAVSTRSRAGSANGPLSAIGSGIASRLDAYFVGDVRALDDIEVDPDGTDFQRNVWKMLREIPPGKTLSYGEVASEVGVPGAARAVGSACAHNPIWLVIPCHRVVRSDGGLGGYAGRMDRKIWLLDHERRSAAC